jgi:hypothetical protein
VAAPSLDYSATDRFCAEELLILLVNFMKIMKSEQAVLPNLCLEEVVKCVLMWHFVNEFL